MANTSEQNGGPAIRILQMSSGGLGDAVNSVNLFRGDVNLPVDLVALTGLGGLDVKVTAFYRSNVRREFETWNREAPTGVLGLGWSLPYDSITLADPGDRQAGWLLNGGGVVRRLLPSEKTVGGRQEFHTEVYEPWRILYDPAQEEWEIVKEDGIAFVYGGQGDGNAVQWGIEWAFGWVGGNMQPAPHQRFALAWNLREIRDPFGLKVAYSYLADELQVYAGAGKTYTRASYLESIVDVFGRRVVFTYRDKLYSSDRQEYADPHKFLKPSVTEDVPPSNLDAPSGFQDRYETRYLAAIRVESPHGHTLHGIRFEHELRSLQEGDPQLAKRFLVAIRPNNAYGEVRPGMKLGYYLGPSDVLPGALRSIRYPGGAITTYEYGPANLSQAKRNLALPLEGKVPRIFWGSDYAVVALHRGQLLELAVYEWAGTWRSHSLLAWHCTEKDFPTLRVAAQDELIVAYWRGAGRVRAWRRDRDSYGRWLRPEEFPLSGSATATGEPTLVAGASFFLLDEPGLSSRLTGHCWAIDAQHPEGEWRSLILPRPAAGAKVAIASTRRRFAVYSGAASDNVRLGICGSPGEAPKIHAASFDFGTPAGFVWTLSDTFAVATYGEHRNYSLKMLAWDAEERAIRDLTPDQAKGLSIPPSLPFQARIYEDTLVASGVHGFRFLGSRTRAGWSYKKLDIELDSGASFDLAAGDDTLVAAREGRPQAFRSAAYQVADGSWRAWRGTSSGQHATLAGDLATIDDKVCLRQPAAAGLDWIETGATLPPTGGAPDLGTLVNAAPAYLLYQTKSDDRVDVAFPHNGRLLRQAERLPAGQRHRADGFLLQSASMFATYEGKSFEAATRLHLYWVVGRSALGELTDYRVVKVEVDGIYPSRGSSPQKQWTSFRYDDGSASVSAGGEVAQYSKVTTLPADDAQRFGSTLRYFLNGLELADRGLQSASEPYREFERLVEGYPALSLTFDDQGKPIVLERGNWRRLPAERGEKVIRQTRSDRLTCFTELRHDNRLPSNPGNSEVLGVFGKGGLPPLGAAAEVLVWEPGHFWLVYDPTDLALPLHFLVRANSQVFACLALSTETAFNAHGLAVESATFHHDEKGRRRKVTSRLTFGTDPESPYRLSLPPGRGMADVHLLNAVILIRQETSEIDSQGRPHEVVHTGAEATTWSELKGWVPVATYLAASAAAAARGFDFLAGHHDGWIETRKTRLYDARGSAILTDDTDGLSYYAIPDRLGRPLARLEGNAEWAYYYGFEEHEEARHDWTNAHFDTSGGQIVEEAELPFGSRCLRIAAGTPAAPATVGYFGEAIQNPALSTYLVAFWINLPESYDPRNGALSVEIASETRSRKVELDRSTGGRWQFFYLPFSLAEVVDRPEPGQVYRLSILLRNAGSARPALAGFQVGRAGLFTANVYDPEDGSITATLGPNGAVHRILHDDDGRPVVAVNASGHVETIRTAFDSVAAHGAYDPREPSSEMQVEARGETYFGHGFTGWQQRWRPHAHPQDWQIARGALEHVSDTSAGLLELEESGGQRDFGLYFKLGTVGGSAAERRFDLRQPLSVSFGAGTSLSWTPLDPGWELRVAHRLVARHDVDKADAIARSWLILVIADALVFYGDGRQLLAWQAEPEAFAGKIGLATGDRLAFRDMVFFADPTLKVSYLDGGGRVRQRISAEAAPAVAGGRRRLGMLAIATLYDQLGRRVVETKPVHFPETLPAWRPLLVGEYEPDAGQLLSGELLAAYPADGPYPFWRSRYLAASQDDVVEIGQPGPELAIHPDGRGHTVRVERWVNGPADDFDVPSGQYCITRQTDANGVSREVLSNAAGQVLALRHGQSWIRYSYDAAGRVLSTEPPNGAAFISRSRFDFLGREIEVATPDAGTSRYLYDRFGRLRFAQDAKGAADSYFQYKTYDPFGRPLEAGTAKGSWNQLSQAQADDPGYAPAERSAVHRYTYDAPANGKVKPDPAAYGAAPYLMGRLSSVETRDGVAGVTETFAYDPSGRVVEKELAATAENGPFKIAYGYDNAGKVVRIGYPGDPALEVFYGYDTLGRMTSVGVTPGGAELATYSWHPMGGLKGEILGGQLERSLSYGSAGWLERIEDPQAQARLDYFSGGWSHGQGYYSGDIAKLETRYRDWTAAEKLEDYLARFSYDARGRLEVAHDPAREEWRVAFRYDLNGNFTEIERGGERRSCSYYPSTNRLRTDGGSGEGEFSYDPNGNVERMPARMAEGKTYPELRLSYCRFSGMTRRIELGDSGATLTFLYDSRNRRVRKRRAARSVLYLHGLGAQPLAEQRDAAFLRYVYGAGGALLAVRQGQSWAFVATDHEGSIERVVDGGGKVRAAFAYLPFGETMQSMHAERSPYRFLGRELDAETGLYHFGARLYDSRLGRFLAVDPAGQFASPYLYAGDDPVRFTDPTGLWSWEHTAGLLLGLAEVGAGLTVGGPAVLFAGVAGISSTIKRRDEDFSWGQYFQDQAGAAIGGAEIAGGVALSVLSGGALASTAGQTLIGAGVSGVSYSVFHEGDFDWADYGKEQAVGALGGLISGGVGAGGGALIQKAGLEGAKALAAKVGVGMLAELASAKGTQAFGAATGWGGEKGNWSSLYSRETLQQDMQGVLLAGAGGFAEDFAGAGAKKPAAIASRGSFRIKADSQGAEILDRPFSSNAKKSI